jgi:hypothetical protein
MIRPERGDASPSTGATTKRCFCISLLWERIKSLGARFNVHSCGKPDEVGAPVAPIPLGSTTAMSAKGHACESADAPMLTIGGFGCAHLLALPHELLVLVLASLSGLQLCAFLTCVQQPIPVCRYRLLFGHTIGHALAAAGACCKAFSVGVHEAATVVAGRHGWRLPLVGNAPKRLSKLEKDTKWARFFLRDNKSAWPSAPNHELRALVAFLHLWVHESMPDYICAPLIDPQVRQQHALELGEFLIEFAMGVCPDHPQYDWLSGLVFHGLVRLMAPAGTPLTASWLAARVFPLANNHLGLIAPSRNRKNVGLIRLLGYVEPHVLRSHRETFPWLKGALQIPLSRLWYPPEVEATQSLWYGVSYPRWWFRPSVISAYDTWF